MNINHCIDVLDSTPKCKTATQALRKQKTHEDLMRSAIVEHKGPITPLEDLTYSTRIQEMLELAQEVRDMLADGVEWWPEDEDQIAKLQRLLNINAAIMGVDNV